MLSNHSLQARRLDHLFLKSIAILWRLLLVRQYRDRTLANLQPLVAILPWLRRLLCSWYDEIVVELLLELQQLDGSARLRVIEVELIVGLLLAAPDLLHFQSMMAARAFPALANAASDPRHHLLAMTVNELRVAVVLLRAPYPGATPTFEVEVADVWALAAPLPLEIVLRVKHQLLVVV